MILKLKLQESHFLLQVAKLETFYNGMFIVKKIKKKSTKLKQLTKSIVAIVGII